MHARMHGTDGFGSRDRQVDNRMRAWYQKDMAIGLLYTCALGEVRPDCPVALIQNLSDEGLGPGAKADSLRVIPCEHQLPQQREQVPDRPLLWGPCLPAANSAQLLTSIPGLGCASDLDTTRGHWAGAAGISLNMKG